MNHFRLLPGRPFPGYPFIQHLRCKVKTARPDKCRPFIQSEFCKFGLIKELTGRCIFCNHIAKIGNTLLSGVKSQPYFVATLVVCLLNAYHSTNF